MEKTLENLNQQIDALALKTVMADAGDIPGLGDILQSLEAIEIIIGELDDAALLSVIHAMKGYIEKIILTEQSELSPFENAISELQKISINLIKGKPVETDVSSLLASLGVEATASTSRPSERGEAIGDESQAISGPPEMSAVRKPDDRVEAVREKQPALSQEDKEIIADFVAESLENLGSIEVKLIDLEQDPTDMDTINAIFRPFHTVKGVSGFLNFNKINKLSHIVENLLDKARNEEIRIDEEIIDLILDSVDILSRMIENVQASLNNGTPSEGDLDIEILTERVEHFIALAEGKDEKPLGEILIERGVIQKPDLEEALHDQKGKRGKKIGEILVEDNKVETKEVISALRDQKRSSLPVALHVKIDTGKLDNVVDMVGELAIAQSMLRQNKLVKTARSRGLDHIINQMNQITSALQKTAMSLRMVPIKNTFQKMLRLVRDLARKANKEVQLLMSGEDTEIDRNMVEEIYEPMVHMIRNSIDHGLEPLEERKAVNKPGKGTIILRAYHKGGNIVIEIEDDGRGLNQEKILEKAIAKGLVREGEKLTESEINNLIFHPGFSTAETITDISGRGVGMDVVKSKVIERLRGRVEVQSVQGKGTTIRIRLPLTLAIIDGMIVGVRGERFIIPTLTVQESFKPDKDDYLTVQGKGEMIKVRDSLAPLICLDQFIKSNGDKDLNSPEKPPWERLVVVVENQERRRCLLIDELMGQEEVVIKSLGETLKKVKGIAGGAIMGDGKVSLILDIAGLFDMTSGG